MDDRVVEWTRGEFTISTDRARLDPTATLALLHTTFWANEMTPAQLARAYANSVCFGVFRGPELIGLARAITDLATYAYLTDVVIAQAYRGQGLGHWLVECILAHPDMQGFRRIALLTRDARRLYEQCGFSEGSGRSTYMEIRAPMYAKP